MKQEIKYRKINWKKIIKKRLSGYNVVPPHEEISNSQFPMLSINTTNGALKGTGLVKKEYMDEFWTKYATRLNVIRIGEMGMGVDNRTFDRIN